MIDIHFLFPDLAAKLKGATDEIRLFAAATIQTNRGLLFDREGEYNGHNAWRKPLFRNGQTGAQRGNLRKSIGVGGAAGPGGVFRIAGDKIEIGSKLRYAAMFNYGTAGLPGGVLRAKPGGVLRIPIPSGQRATPAANSIMTTPSRNKKSGKVENVIFRKWVKIPARDFRTFNDFDVAELGEALRIKLAEVMNG